MTDAISMEETNRIRASLGMKPLPVPGGPAFVESDGSSDSEEEASTLETREAQGTDNWNKHIEEAESKRKKEARKEAIKKAREKAKRYEKLEGKGLGDADEDELDTKTWLVQQKKRQKKLDKERARAQRMEEELRQREEQAYTAKDLAGVKVGHQASAFDLEVGEQILTLKDATIDEYEEEGDELENIDLREKERLGDRLDLKKKKPAYDPNADEDEDEDRTVLKQYDEVIDGKKRKRFTLGAEGVAAEADTRPEGAKRAAKGQAISLDILREVVASDYQEPKEVTFKKPKKSKKKKSTRQKALDDDDDIPAPAANGDSMDVDNNDAPARPKPSVDSFIDDDDMQAVLARSRKQALKKRTKTSAKDLAQQVRQEELDELPDDGQDDSGLVIDETSEFVANLRPNESETPPRHASPTKGIDAIKSAGPVEAAATGSDDDGDVDMKQSYADIKDEPDEEAPAVEPQLTETGLEADTQLDRGLGAAMNLLRSRGLVEKSDGNDLTTQYRHQQRFMSEKRRREEMAEQRARQQRERDRASGRLDRMSGREREEWARRENQHREQQESRQMADVFNREYRPTVELRYVDEHGRSVGPKEAFKNLSHQFHGKGSGKQKTEKQLKKIEKEKQHAAQSVLSGQSSGSTAMGSTAKKHKQAGVRLA